MPQLYDPAYLSNTIRPAEMVSCQEHSRSLPRGKYINLIVIIEIIF